MRFVKNKWWLILIGTAVWSATMVKSGLIYKFGMGFWGPNGHDGVWHLALIKSLGQGSLRMPIFAGQNIHNYHIGFDAVMAGLAILTRIPAHFIYFQLFPVVAACTLGWMVYKFVYAWKKSHSQAMWVVAFTYFATSWGWVVNWLRYADWGGESMFWAQQAVSTLLNPPFAMSLIVMFAGLWCLHQKKYNWAMALFGVLGFVKIYAGLLVLGGLFVAGIHAYIYRKNSKWLAVWLGSTILGILFFLPLNHGSGQVIVWQPGWFLETMMAVSDRANWPKFYEAMVNYRSGHDFVKGPIAYGVAMGIFMIGNLGLRIVGWKPLFKKRLTEWEVLFACIIAAGFILPMLVLQRGTPWNTIQFSYYSLVFFGVFAGIAMAGWKRQKLAICVFVVATLPGAWGTVRQYLPSRPPAKLSLQEVQALDYLSKLPPGVVLTVPFDKDLADAAQVNPPRPLSLYESTAYVAAFSGKQVFLEDQVNLDITGYPWQGRREDVLSFFRQQDPKLATDFLSDNQIQYLYLDDVANRRPILSDTQLGMDVIYENSQVAIWKKE